MMERTGLDAIAVVGMACVFPGAHSPIELWQNVLAGRRAFRKAPAERLPLDSYYDPNPETPDKTYSDQIAVITDWIFNPAEFHIPPVTVEATDPTHWLALWTAREAFRDAGVSPAELGKSRVGVVLGNTLAGEYSRAVNLRFRWPFVERALRRSLDAAKEQQKLDPDVAENVLSHFRQEFLNPIPLVTEDTLAGSMSNTIAGRICNHFDLQGGGYTIDGACSSSLLAITKACESLTNGDLDLVLAGGVDISLDPFELVGFAKARALAVEDIRPYDKRANGMLPGEGCGLVVLMRADDAANRNIRVRARIRGWGYSSDGRGAITAPRIEGQVEAIRRAYNRAGYPISSVALIEGHGTGTALGDQVELSAILQVLGEDVDAVPCRIGSIKGNIGHCKAAAGIAGLIKAIMALERKLLPPSSGCEYPNDLLNSGPLAVALDGAIWRTGATPRRAAVSAFGFGGSNAHLTLEESEPGPDQDAPAAADLQLLGSMQETELILISAPDREMLLHRIKQVSRTAAKISRAELTDLAAALSRAEMGDLRVAIVANSPWHLTGVLAGLEAALAGDWRIEELADPDNGLFAGAPDAHGRDRKLVALFPGQGSQRPGMAAQFARRYPFVRDLYDRCSAAGANLLPEVLSGSSLGDAARRHDEAGLRDTRIAQPAIVAASLASLRVLEYFGLRPDFCLGHSLGEITAICAAGALDEETAMRVVAIRGRAIGELPVAPRGTMAAASCSAALAAEIIDTLAADAEISNYNSPNQTVVSGEENAIAAFTRMCIRRGVPVRPLPVSHAFHSSLVAPAAVRLGEALRSIAVATPRLPVISTVTGQLLDPHADLTAHLIDHVAAPVRFAAAVECAHSMSPTIWLEIGPGAVLCDLVRQTIGHDAAPVLPTDPGGTDRFTAFNNVIGCAFVLGFPVAVDKLFAHRFFRPISIGDYAPRLIINPCERSGSSIAARPKAPTSSLPPTPGSDTRAEIVAFVTGWIARRTGYRQETVGIEMRLRDDLNLDSIKATELIHILLERCGRRLQPLPGWQNLRIGELVDAVLNKDIHDGDRGASTLDPAEGPQQGADWVHSFHLVPQSVPIDSEPALAHPDPPSVLVIAYARCHYVGAVTDCLIDAGFAPVVVDIERLTSVYEIPPPVGAFVWLLPDLEPQRSAGSPLLSTSGLHKQAKLLFDNLRWLLSTSLGQTLPVRLVVARLADAASVQHTADAGAALLKSLTHEYPQLRAKWLRLPGDWEPARYGEAVAKELQRGGSHIEYAYREPQHRYAVTAKLAQHEGSGLVLDEGDVVLVTGGARGITAELAATIGSRYGARLALLGRAAPDQAEVIRTLRRFEGAGLIARYWRCDVTDAEQVDKTLALVEQRLGPVTVLLHGAGISKPAPLQTMSFDDCWHCITVKAVGLVNLLNACPPGRLKAIHLLSSVLGSTGMVNQADYALANGWLNAAATALKRSYPHLHVLALGYSLWDGAGLAERLGVVEVLRRLGVTALDPARGVAAYQAALGGATDNPNVVITGRLTPLLEAVLFSMPPRPTARFHERVLRFIPQVEMVAESTLSLGSDLYLSDHRLEDTPIVPAVMGIEAMIATAMVLAERTELPMVKDVQFLLPIVVPEGAKVGMRVYAMVQVERDGSVAVRTVLRAASDGFAEDRFAATCIFASVGPELTVDELDSPLPSPLPLRQEDLPGQGLFYGPLFRRLSCVRRLEVDDTCIAEISVAADAQYFSEASSGPLRTPFPATRDGFLQTLLLLTGRPGVITRIEEIRFADARPADDSLVCRARRRAAGAQRWLFDVDVFSRDGALIETLHGIEAAPAGRFAAALPAAPSRLAEELAKRCSQVPHAVALVGQTAMPGDDAMSPRLATAQTNKLAVRQAIVQFAANCPELELDAATLELQHDANGRPSLWDVRRARRMDGVHVSISDTAECSVAVVSLLDVGIDLERIENRSPKQWPALLGDDGYALAVRIAALACEPFQVAATRVWSVVEASAKLGFAAPGLSRAEIGVEPPSWIRLKLANLPELGFISVWLAAEARLPHSTFTMAYATGTSPVADRSLTQSRHRAPSERSLREAAAS